jgi:signal peptidase I
VFEPFKIPSASMLPTLQIGDFLMAKKYAYQWQWPVWGGKIHTFSKPKIGDVVLFPYKVNPAFTLIKRVVATGGDEVSYVNHQLIINGHKMPLVYQGETIDPNDSNTQKVKVYQENLNGVKHLIYIEPWAQDPDFYNVKVPKGEVMAMGDNRNNSEDSRFWGFVPVDSIFGKAYRIWLSVDWSHFKIRWNRFGKLI